MRKAFFIFSTLLLIAFCSTAQDKGKAISKTADSLGKTISNSVDSLVKRRHNPKKATLYSVILPGMGQIYNRKYWKVPLVYAVVGTPVYMYLDNKKWYERTKQAALMLGSTPMDTANWRNRVDEKLYVFFTRSNTLPSLLNYRNELRKSMDYSILFTMLCWGLNVMDATVDGHLKEFDVSPSISMHVKPTLLTGPPGQVAGVSMIFTIGNRREGFGR